ncbi:MAG: PAS domain S-box protein, partial [Chloroflexi bacterium]|nr:PAS domain S-box protein [Chloroflexota bacterium]
SVGLIGIGCVLFVVAPREQISTRNKIALISAIILQVMAEVLYALGITPIPGVNLSPVFLIIFGLICLWAILHDRLFGIVPGNNTAIMESLEELIIILDANHCIAKSNHAAREALDLVADSLGVPVTAMSFEWAQLISQYIGKDVRRLPVQLHTKGSLRYYELSISVMKDRSGSFLGHLCILHDISENKEAEDMLRHSREALVEAQKIAHMGNWTWHLDTGRINISDGMYQLYGISQDTAPSDFGNIMINSVHPDDRAAVEEYNKRMMREKQTSRLQYRIIWPDGSLHYIYTEVANVTVGDAGQVQVLSGISQDITQRVFTEDALRENEAKFHSLFEQSQIGIIILNKNEEIVDVNDAYCKLIGYTHDEIMHIKYIDIIPPDLRPPEGPVLLPEQIQGKTLETTLLHRDGRSIPVEVTTTELRGMNGLVVSLVRDISERKWSEEALRENEERYRSLVMFSPDAVLVTQHERVTLANYACARLFGADLPEALYGVPFFKLIHPDYQELMRDRIYRMHESGQAVPPVRQSIIRLDGRSVDVEVSAAPFMLNGEFTIHVILRDITERLRTEEALRDSEAFNKTVLDNLPVGIAVNTGVTSLNFSYINDNFVRFYHTTREKLSQPNSFWEAVYEDPVLREQMRERITADWASGNPERMLWEDIPIARRGEETTYVTARDIPLPNQPLVISTVWDVTQRRKAEEALRESEERYRSLLLVAPVAISVFTDGRMVFINPAGVKLLGAASADELIGSPYSKMFLPGYQEDYQEAMNQPEAGGYTEYPLEGQYQRQDGSWVDVEVLASPLVYQGRPGVQIIAVDISERKRAEASLLLHLQREQKIADLGRELASTLEINEVYRIVSEQLGDLIDCPNLAIELFDAAQGLINVAFVITEGERVDTTDITPLPYQPDEHSDGRSQAIAGQHPVVVTDLASRVESGAATLIGSGQDPLCAIYVPMMAEGRVIGLLDLQSYRENAYTEEDGIWLESVANLIGLAIQQARLHSEAQRTAVAEERNRLAGELHDAVSQTLFSSNLTAETLVRLLDKDPNQVRTGLVKLQQLNRSALAEMRTLLMELRPANLLKTKLQVLLGQLASAVLGRSSAEVFTDLDDVPTLPPDVHIALYRISQEALNNITKHADAVHIWITLRQLGDGVELSIRDDGRGFNPDHIPYEHQGLQIMRERAEKAGIVLAFSSIIGQGTLVTAKWVGP